MNSSRGLSHLLIIFYDSFMVDSLNIALPSTTFPYLFRKPYGILALSVAMVPTVCIEAFCKTKVACRYCVESDPTTCHDEDISSV